MKKSFLKANVSIICYNGENYIGNFLFSRFIEVEDSQVIATILLAF